MRLTEADHFAHRETDGIVVDLFWSRRDQENEFLVQVEDRREGERFVLQPTTGKEAIEAFHHPFSDVNAAHEMKGHRRAGRLV